MASLITAFAGFFIGVQGESVAEYLKEGSGDVGDEQYGGSIGGVDLLEDYADDNAEDNAEGGESEDSDYVMVEAS